MLHQDGHWMLVLPQALEPQALNLLGALDTLTDGYFQLLGLM